MKKTTVCLIALAIMTMFQQSFGQTDTTRIKVESHTSVQTGPDYSYDYNYDYSYDYSYSYEMPKYPVKGGVKLNGNLSGFVITDNPNLRSKVKFGLSFGGFMTVYFSEHFALQCELLCSYKISELRNKTKSENTNYSYWGLELPIYAIGQLQLGKGRGFIGIGPYISTGLSLVSKSDNANLYKKNKITNERMMNRWDVGIGFMLGYEFEKGISLHAGYQLGFVNMVSAQKDDYSMTNLAVSLGIAYKF
jgi:hypothetical protein